METAPKYRKRKKRETISEGKNVCSFFEKTTRHLEYLCSHREKVRCACLVQFQLNFDSLCDLPRVNVKNVAFSLI